MKYGKDDGAHVIMWTWLRYKTVAPVLASLSPFLALRKRVPRWGTLEAITGSLWELGAASSHSQHEDEALSPAIAWNEFRQPSEWAWKQLFLLCWDLSPPWPLTAALQRPRLNQAWSPDPQKPVKNGVLSHRVRGDCCATKENDYNVEKWATMT